MICTTDMAIMLPTIISSNIPQIVHGSHLLKEMAMTFETDGIAGWSNRIVVGDLSVVAVIC